jgi:hypothetical protein
MRTARTGAWLRTLRWRRSFKIGKKIRIRVANTSIPCIAMCVSRNAEISSTLLSKGSVGTSAAKIEGSMWRALWRTFNEVCN